MPASPLDASAWPAQLPALKKSFTLQLGGKEYKADGGFLGLEDGVERRSDPLFVDPEFALVGRRVALDLAVARDVLDDDQWPDSLAPQHVGATELAIKHGRHAKDEKPVGRLAAVQHASSEWAQGKDADQWAVSRKEKRIGSDSAASDTGSARMADTNITQYFRSAHPDG